MLNSLLWSSCLYIKISEWPQWWQRSHSTSVIRLENTATCWVIFNTVFCFFILVLASDFDVYPRVVNYFLTL